MTFADVRCSDCGCRLLWWEDERYGGRCEGCHEEAIYEELRKAAADAEVIQEDDD